MTDKEKLDRIIKKRVHIHKSIKKLFNITNIQAQISRNSLCICGSGLKWKRCCIVKHEKRCLAMDKLTLMYRDLTIKAINLKRKIPIVKT